MKTSRGKYISLSNILMYLFLVVIVLLSVFPLYWMLAATTNMTVDIVKGKIWLGTYFIENFKTLISQTSVLRAFWNSMRNSVIGTFSSLFICSMAGYGFQIFRDKAKDRVMSILLLSMMVPFAAVMVPLYRMFAQVHLLNTTAAFILPSVSTAFLIFFFRQSAHTFPLELVQAARVDGLGEFSIYLRIFFPVMAPTFAAAAIVNFMGHWNDYMWPLVIQQPGWLSNKSRFMRKTIKYSYPGCLWRPSGRGTGFVQGRRKAFPLPCRRTGRCRRCRCEPLSPLLFRTG
jgi:lactose/L-arabinose transport system permease protein